MGQLEDIQVFVRVVEAGGVGKAAEQLHLAKSAVSRRLADLEARLKTKLIHRTTRSSSLTEAGRLYYQRALGLLDAVAEMNQLAEAESGELEGCLRLALPLSFGLEHLSPLLDEFARQHPKLQLHMDFSDREVALVEEGFDLAFRIADLKDTNLQARLITPIDFVLCASPDYLARFGEPKDVTELKAHQGLRYTAEQASTWPLVDAEGRTHLVHPDSRIQANNGHFLMQMAIAGHGLVLLPRFIAWQALQNGELQAILTHYTIPTMGAYALYPQNRFVSQKARSLIDFLVARLGQGSEWLAH